MGGALSGTVLEWIGDRRPCEPTAEELAFARALAADVEDLQFLLLDDPSGPWMTVTLEVDVRGLGEILRLDFDPSGIEGGWSSSGFNADCGLRARHVGLPITSGKDHLRIPSGDLGPVELAREAAVWFHRIRAEHEG